MNEPQQNQVVRFNEFEVDAARRLVFRSGEACQLGQKAFDLLVELIHRRETVVSKNDLLDAVWPDQFVEEKNLTVQIAALRKFFGEGKNENRFIATVPGKGYKFVADIDSAGISDIVIESRRIDRIFVEDETIETITEPAAQRTQHSFVVYAVMGLLFVVVVVLAGSMIKSSANTESSAGNFSIKRLTSTGNVTSAAISPNGKLFLYAVRGEGTSLWMGQTDGSQATELRPPATGTNYHSFHFSKDESTFFFVMSDGNRSSVLCRMSIFGGPVEELRAGVGYVTFSPDEGQIAFVRSNQISSKTQLVVSGIRSNEDEPIVERPLVQRFASFSAAWSPDGKRIAFGSMNEDGDGWDVYLVTMNDREVQRVSQNRWSTIRSIAWQSDGSKLIVGANEQTPDGSEMQLYEVVMADGRVSRLVTDLLSYTSPISISADGTLVLATPGQSIGNIWAGPVGQPEQSDQLTEGLIGERSGGWGIAWSGSQKIVYSKFLDKTRSLWVMNSDGSSRRQLVPAGGENFYPSVSADGQTVVFQSNRDGENGVWSINIGGSNLRKITGAYSAEQPQISPDGRTVIFISSKDGRSNLYKASVDGGEAVELAQNASWPGISGDGRLVAFGQRDASDRMTIVIISIEGGPPIHTLKPAPNRNVRLGVRWSPDGRSVVHRSWESGLWVHPIDGGEPVKMEGLPDEKLYGFDWSTDGKYFAYARGNEIKDVVLIERPIVQK
jgi:Tol biopolymer transport system component/DNA-binding winged helix-turn-helix (wHTH) protein